MDGHLLIRYIHGGHSEGNQWRRGNPLREKSKAWASSAPLQAPPQQYRPGDESNPDGTEEEYNPDQPAFGQAEQEDEQVSPSEQGTDGYPEEDNYMPPSEDEISQIGRASCRERVSQLV